MKLNLKKRKIFFINDEKRGWIFISPIVILGLCLFVYPLVKSFFDSFKDQQGNFINIANYLQVFSDSRFWIAFKNTIIFTFASVFLHLIIGLCLALLLNIKIKNTRIESVKNVANGFLIMPWLIATVVASAIWILMLNPIGILNYLLNNLNIISTNISWLGDPRFALFAVIIVNVWKYFPFFMIIILSGLKSISVELYEAAKVDGARPYQSFLYITLPLLKNVIMFVTLLDAIWTFRHFDLVYIMTGGGPMHSTELLSNYIYEVTFRNLKFNYGSTIAIIMLALSMIVSLFYIRMYRENE